MQKDTKLKIMAALFSAAFFAVGAGMPDAYASALTQDTKLAVTLSDNATDSEIAEANAKLGAKVYSRDANGKLTVDTDLLKAKTETEEAAKDNGTSFMSLSAEDSQSQDNGSGIYTALQSVQGKSRSTSSDSKSNSKTLSIDPELLEAMMKAADNSATQADSSSTSSTDSSTAGTITATDSITAGGTIQTKVLSAGSVEAVTGTITGNQNVNGTFTAGGVANLNGGADLNNQKITGLADGTISETSTDAITGKQLYAVQEQLKNAGKTYTAGSDIAISSDNAISVKKDGQVAADNTGIVTGGAVYDATNKLDLAINNQKSLVSSQDTSITSLSSGISSLKNSIANINSNVMSSTKSLSSSLTNRMQNDLGNITDDGKAVIKDIIKEVLKGNTTSASTTAEGIASPVATYEAKAVPTDGESAGSGVSSKDIEDLKNQLDDKVNKTDFNALKDTVDGNTTKIAENAEKIKTNAADIKTLQETKANADGSNIDVTKFTEKLGIGKVEKDDKNLVTGGTVYDALQGKADQDYVDAGFKSMNEKMQDMERDLTRDINRVGAGAAALAGLHPQDYDPNNKVEFAAGYGHYRNANAMALGVFYRPNGGTTLSLAGTIGNGDPMLSAGVSFKLGMGKNVEKVMVSKEQYEAQLAENQAMKDQLNDNDKKIEQLEAMLKDLLKK